MTRGHRSLRAVLLGGTLLVAAYPALAAEVTSDRLINADKEPQNWLMNHRTYDAQRYSPLDRINRQNVNQLKLSYAVALGGTSTNENLESTPLAEDGYLYIVDQWGVIYKIDGRSGDTGRILWRMDPGQEKLPLANRGAALWGNFVVTVANYPPRVIATDKDTGKVAWEANLSDGQTDLQLTAAPLAVKDKIILGAAGGDHGVRDFMVALDGATGRLIWRKYVVPAPGEPGSETWKDKNNAWQTGGGAMWVTGSYDVGSNQVFWGTGNPVPMYDAYYRPGDNLYTNSVISWDPDTGRMNWFHQYVPGDMWDYDAAGSHILIDGSRTNLSCTPRGMDSSTASSAPMGSRYWRSPIWTRSTGRRESTRRPDCRSTTIQTETSRSIRACKASPLRTAPRNSALRMTAAAISGPPHTAAGRSCSTFRRGRPAMKSRSLRTTARMPTASSTAGNVATSSAMKPTSSLPIPSPGM